MQINSSKIFIYSILGIIATGLILASFPALDIITKKNLSFCLSSGCFETAYLIFEEPIKIIKNFAIFATFATAIIGSFIGLSGYLETLKRDAHNRHNHNLVQFKLQMKKILEEQNTIHQRNININKLYKLIYPRSESGEITTSNTYILTIQKIANQIITSDKNYGTGAPNTVDIHYSEMLKSFNKLGIEIEEPDIRSLIRLEPSILESIDIINSTITDLEVKLASLPRSYEASIR